MKTRYGLPNRAIRKTAVIVAALAAASSANALYFEFGDDAAWQLDWDTNISYTAQWRVAKQDADQFAFKDLGGNDPIASLRRHTVLINANDMATSGATPRWMLTTLLFPPGSTPSAILAAMADIRTHCRKWGISLCGGHTEITPAVSQPVVSSTLIPTAE